MKENNQKSVNYQIAIIGILFLYLDLLHGQMVHIPYLKIA